MNSTPNLIKTRLYFLFKYILLITSFILTEYLLKIFQLLNLTIKSIQPENLG